jgi:hypothetical protein
MLKNELTRGKPRGIKNKAKTGKPYRSKLRGIDPRGNKITKVLMSDKD